MIKKSIQIYLLLLLFFIIFCVQASKEEDYQNKKIKVYLQALIQQGERTKVKDILKEKLKKSHDLKSLEFFSKLALRNGLNNIAQRFYQRILIKDKTNKKAMKGLGVSAYYSNNHKISKKFLKKYNQKTGGNFLTHFLLGEIFNSPKYSYSKAKKEYKKSINLIKQSKTKTLEQKNIKALILFRLNKIRKSLASYEQILENNPKNISSQFDYIRILIEINRYNKAKKLLKKNSSILNQRKITISKLKEGDLSGSPILSNKLLWIRYYTATQQLYTAMKMTKNLLKKFPKNHQLLKAKSDIHAAMGDWRNQLSTLNEAIKFSRNENLYNDQINNIKKNNYSNIEINPALKISKDRDGQMTTQFLISESINLRLKKWLEIGVTTEENYLSASEIQHKDGYEKSFNSMRFRSEIFANFDFGGNEYLNASNLRLSYFMGDSYSIKDDAGFGIKYNYLDYWGDTQLTVNYRKPYWELPTGVVVGAKKSKVQLTRSLEIFPSFNLELRGSLNRYSTQKIHKAANSIQYLIDAEYILPEFIFEKELLGEDFDISLNYRLNSEIYSQINEETRDDGQTYQSLPLVDRQVHTLTMNFTKTFNKNLFASIYGGYSIDALGEDYHGPVFGADISYDLNKFYNLGITTYHSIGIVQSSYLGLQFECNLHNIINKYDF